jgi:septal ring factor EnvC (AmiA/AmiB activator)
MEVSMSTPNADSNLPKPAQQEKGLIPETAKLVAIIVLFLFVIYLVYENFQTKKAVQSEVDRITEQLQSLEESSKLSEASLSSQIAGLKEEINGTRSAVVDTKTELKSTAAKMQADRKQTVQELNQALARKTAEVTARVQEARSEADTKITDVNTEVDGVKSDVVQVKADLEDTKTELSSAQTKLASMGESFEAAIAKNSTELAQLRLKGERDYYEFDFPKKKKIVKVEDIRLELTKTDHKKGKYNMKIHVDDTEIEKKDLLVNEPVQFLVGRNRVRYEVVINWVEKNKAGGYLAVPKDKTLSSIGVPIED